MWFPGDVRTLTVVVEQCLAPVPGGTGRYAAQISAALAERAPSGWQVRPVTAWHRSVAGAAVPGALPVRRLPAGRRLLAAAWQRGGPPHPGGDSLHATTPLAPARRRTPVVATVHDIVPWTHPETLTPRGVAWHRAMIQRIARTADAIVVPSRAVADGLAGLLPLGDRVTVIPHGATALPVPVDAAARRASRGLPDRYVLSVSTLEPRKGLDVLLAAVARPALAGIHLVVVGPPGWGELNLTEAADRAGVAADQMHVTGFVDDADLAAILAGAGVLAVPSRAEGFGLPLLEGMAAGVPVVHSADPALVELADSAGLVVPIGDVDALAEALGRVLGNPDLAGRMRTAGRARAAPFTWSAAADRTWRLHRELAR